MVLEKAIEGADGLVKSSCKLSERVVNTIDVTARTIVVRSTRMSLFVGDLDALLIASR